MNTLTDNDFLQIINWVCAQEKHSHVNFTDMKDLSENLTDTGLDSLGVMMFYVLLDEVFGIPEEAIEDGSTNNLKTGSDVFNFIKENQTRGFTMEEVTNIFKQFA